MMDIYYFRPTINNNYVTWYRLVQQRFLEISLVYVTNKINYLQEYTTCSLRVNRKIYDPVNTKLNDNSNFDVN